MRNNPKIIYINNGGKKDMKISTKGRYALRVMIDLAMNSNGKYISLKRYSRKTRNFK